MNSTTFYRFFGILALAGVALSGVYAQSGLRISLTHSEPGAQELSWPVQSLVPPPGLPLFTDYQVFTSANLVDWLPLGEPIRGGDFINTTVRVRIAQDGAGQLFCRVQSLLDFRYADIPAFSLRDGNFAHADFFGADLFGSDLSGANFQEADLQAVDLNNAILTSVRFAGANLLGATIINSTINNSDFRGANLSFADFFGALMNGANLAGADLRSSSFVGVEMRYIRLHNTLIDERTLFDSKAEAIWKIVNNQAAGTTLTNLNLSLADLSRANLEHSDLRGSDLSGSDLDEANIRGANLETANLRFVDFRRSVTNELTVLPLKARLAWQMVNGDNSGRELPGVDLSSCFLPFANAPAINLEQANFRFTVLAFANFRGANLARANFSEVDFTGADLREANLTNSVLSGANFTDANLKGADLSGAVVFNVIFNNTTMPDGTIR